MVLSWCPSLAVNVSEQFRQFGITLKRCSGGVTDRADITVIVFPHDLEKSTEKKQQKNIIFFSRRIGTLCFSAIFTKGNSFHDFPFTSLENAAFPKGSQVLEKRICSRRSKFFPLRVDLN